MAADTPAVLDFSNVLDFYRLMTQPRISNT